MAAIKLSEGASFLNILAITIGANQRVNTCFTVFELLLSAAELLMLFQFLFEQCDVVGLLT